MLSVWITIGFVMALVTVEIMKISGSLLSI